MDELNKAKGNPLSAYHLEDRLNIALSMLPSKTGKFLDLGCGEGYFLKKLSQYGKFELYGVDVSKVNLDFAKRLVPNAKFFISDIRSLPFNHSEFDFVSALEVLDHFENPGEVLSEIHRILKNNGTFLMSIPDSESILWNIIWWIWTRTFGQRWVGEHKVSFSEKKLTELLQKNGFNQIKVKRAFFGLIITVSCVCVK
jgi:ubiquinone/menaquinone biosynthesis C-methylase UbiE